MSAARYFVEVTGPGRAGFECRAEHYFAANAGRVAQRMVASDPTVSEAIIVNAATGYVVGGVTPEAGLVWHGRNSEVSA